MKKHLFTVDMRGTTSVTNHTLADLEDVPQADAEANIVDDLVCVFGVDLVFECVDRALGEVLWVDYHEVGERGLCESLSFVSFPPGEIRHQFSVHTSINITKMEGIGFCAMVWYSMVGVGDA